MEVQAVEEGKSLKTIFKRRRDFIAFIAATLLSLSFPMIGIFIIFSLSYVLLFNSVSKIKTIICLISGLVITAIVGFLAFLLLFRPFADENKILYPEIELSSKQEKLYEEIVNYSGYYLPDSVNSYEDNNICFVAVNLKTHYIVSSVGNKKSSYAFNFRFTNEKNANSYIFLFVDKNNKVICTSQ